MTAKEYLAGKQRYLDTDYQFWLLQLMGWSGLSLISFFSLNLWYNQPELGYIAHNILQSVLGILVSWPMRYIFRRLWSMKLLLRFSLASLTVIVFAIVWAALRLVLFMTVTGERGLWPDFGGWLFASIFIFLCWSAFYHGAKYYNLLQQEHADFLRVTAQKQEAELQLAYAENTTREAQLKMLRYQLNPHFLFNTLNAISTLVRTEESTKANAMIVNLSDFLRYSLDNDPTQLIELREEVVALEQYVQIQKTRFGERLQFTIEVSDEAATVKTPSLLLQPLVENAVTYAIAPCELGGTISLYAEIVGDQLCLRLTDSGPGMSEDETPSSGRNGVGLANVKDRLKVAYGDNHSFEVSNLQPHGCQISIGLPTSRPNTEDKPTVSKAEGS